MGSKCCKCGSDKNNIQHHHLQSTSQSSSGLSSSYHYPRSRVWEEVGGGMEEEWARADGPPLLARRLADQAVKVGTRTRLLTEIASSSPLTVIWLHDGKKVEESERLKLVNEGNFYCCDISPVILEDEGIWSCQGHNARGLVSSQAKLTLVVPRAYKKPEFVEEVRAVLGPQGTVSLQTKVTGVPGPSLRWFKEGVEIRAGDVLGLTLDPGDPSLGTYTCLAANCMGTAVSSSRVHVVSPQPESQTITDQPQTTEQISFNTTGPKPIFAKELRNEKMKIGATLVLECQVKVPPWPDRVSWYNSLGEVKESCRAHLMEDGLGGYSVQVSPVEAADDGSWRFVATNRGGATSVTSSSVSISFPKNYRKPKFLDPLKAVLTEEGLVSFECKVVGYPTPQLSWFKDGQELKPGDVYQLTGTNSLGSYCCIARNCMGEAESTAVLTVEDIQSQLTEEERLQLFTDKLPPKFIQGLKSMEAKISEPFTFTVKVSISPEPTMLWFRDDEHIDDTEGRYKLDRDKLGLCSLHIAKLEFADQAEWKCVAMNDYGQSVTSSYLKLNIPRHYKKPKFLEELRAVLSDEGAVNLECKVIGVPQPVLKWFKDGKELKPGDIHRIISGQDGSCCLGTYTCVAQNCMGTVSSSASLLGFQDKPVVVAQKSTTKSPPCVRDTSLSTIQEERTSQLHTLDTDRSLTLDDRPEEVSFSFDGREVSVSLYETPDLTEEEALQIVEMYADQISEHVSEHNVVELPPMRFTKESSTSGKMLMEALVIDVSPDYFTPGGEDDLRTDADLEEFSFIEEALATPDDEKPEIEFSPFRVKQITEDEGSQYADAEDKSLSQPIRTIGEPKRKKKKSIDSEKEDDSLQEFERRKTEKRSSKERRRTESEMEDDSLYEFESRKAIERKLEQAKEVDVKVETVALVEPDDSGEKVSVFKTAELVTLRESRPSVTEDERAYDTAEDLAFDKSEISVLESLAHSLHDIQRGLARVEAHVISDGQEIKSPEVSVLESLAQPIADVQRSLELMEEKIDEGLIGSQVLETLVQPISEFKKNLKIMEEESISSSTTSLQRRTSSIMESLTKPLKDLEREISLIQEQYYPERGISEERYAKSVEEVQETLTKIIERQESVPHDRKIIKTISTELQELEETANDDLEKYYDRLLACSTEMRKKLNNEEDQEIIDILRSVGDFVKPLKHLTGVTSKCISVIVKDYETGGVPSAKLVESLVKPLEALRSTLDLLESVSSLKSHRAIRGAGIPLLYKLSVPMDELDTTIKLVENLSAHTAVEFLVTPLDNLVKVVSSIDISSGGEGFLENLPEEGSRIIKKLDNSLGVMVNSVNSVKNNLNNVEVERDLIEKLPSIMKPMEELQRSLKPIVEIVNEDLSYDDVCEIAQTLSKPLQTLRSELSIMQHEIEIEQYGDISGEKRSVLSELIEPLESVQTSINSFHESVLCKEDPIHLRFVLYALNEMLNPFTTLCSKMRTAEKAIIEGRVMDPYQGLKNVAKSVRELREMSSLTKTDLPVLHRISTIMYKPLEIVETGLMDVLDEVRETSKEKLNSTLLKTLDEPLKILQGALLEIEEEVHISKEDSPELKQTLKDLQRSVLLIQDHASFECGDEPSSLESNIMILESLTQPLQTMRAHMSEIQRSSVRNLIRVDRALTDIKNSAGSVVSAVAGTEEGPLACVLQNVALTLSELGEAAESQNIQIGQGQSMEIARRNVSDVLTHIASSLGDICAQADDISGEFEGESRAALVLIQDLVHDLKSATESTVQVMNEKKTTLEQASVTVTALENLNKSIFSFQNSLTNIDEVVLKMPRKSISMDELKDFVEQLEKDVNLVVDKISILDIKKPPQLLNTIVNDVNCVRNLVVNMAKYDNLDEVLETVKCIEKNLQSLSRDTLKEECIQLNEACKTAQAIVSMQEQFKPVTKEELEGTHSEIIETLIESVKSLESVIEKIRILPTGDSETEKAMYLITHNLVELEENIIALTSEDEIETFSQKLNNIARPLKMIEENLHHVNANIDDVREAEIVMNQMSHVLCNTTEKEISQKSDFEKLFSSESLSLAIDAPLIKGIATTVESMQCCIKPLVSKESNKLVWFLDSFEESLLRFSRNLAENISDVGNEKVNESLTAQLEEMKNELCTADITNQEKSTSLKSALVLLEESLKKEEGSHKILPALQAVMKPLKALHSDVFRVDNLALKVAEKKYVEDFSKASVELEEGLINFEKALKANEPLVIQQLTKPLEILTGYVESLNNDVLFEEVHEKSNIVKLKGLVSHVAEIRTLLSPLEGVILEDRVKVEEMLQSVAGSVSDLSQNVASIEEQMLHQSYSTELLDLKEAVSVVCSHLEEEESLGTLVGPANVLKETLEAISVGKSEPACIAASVSEMKAALEVIEHNEMTESSAAAAVAIPLIDLCHHVVQIIETRVLEGLAPVEVSLSDRATYASLREISDHLHKAAQSTVVAKVDECEDKENLLPVEENVDQRDLTEKSLEKLPSDSTRETKLSDGTSEGEFKSLSDSEEVTRGNEETNKAFQEIKQGIEEKGEDIESSESVVDILRGEPRFEKLDILDAAKETLHSAAVQETVSLNIAEKGVLHIEGDAERIEEEQSTREVLTESAEKSGDGMKKETFVIGKEGLSEKDAEKISEDINKETHIAEKVLPKKDDAEKIGEDIIKETQIAEREVLPKKDDAEKIEEDIKKEKQSPRELRTESAEKSEIHAEMEIEKNKGKSEVRDKDKEIDMDPIEVEEREPTLVDLKVSKSQKSDIQIEKEERSYKETTYSKDKLNSLIHHVNELENEVSSAINLISGTKAKFSAQPILESVIIDIKSVKRVAENLLREIHLDKTRVKFISDKARFIEDDLSLVINDILKEDCLALNTAVNIVKLIRDIKLIDEESESEDEDLLEIRNIKKKLEEVKKEAEQLGRKSIVPKEIDEAVESEPGENAFDATRKEDTEGNEGFKESALWEGSDEVTSSKKLIEEEKTRQTEVREVEEEGEKKAERKVIVEQQVNDAAILEKGGDEKLERVIDAGKGGINQEEEIGSKEDGGKQITKKVEVDKQRERRDEENEECLITKKNTDEEKQKTREAENKQKDKETKEKRRTSKDEELSEENKIEDKVAKNKEAEENEKKEVEEIQKLKNREEENKKKELEEKQKLKDAKKGMEKKEPEENKKLKAADEEKKKEEAEEDQKLKAGEKEKKKREAVVEEKKEIEVEEKQKLKDAKKEKKKKETEEGQKLKAADEQKKEQEAELIPELKPTDEEKGEQMVDEDYTLKADDQKLIGADEEKIMKEAEKEVKLKVAEEENKKSGAPEEEKDVGDEKQKLKDTKKEKKIKGTEVEQKLKVDVEEMKKEESENQQLKSTAGEKMRTEGEEKGIKEKQSEEKETINVAEEESRKNKDAKEELLLKGAKEEKRTKRVEETEKEEVEEKQNLIDERKERKKKEPDEEHKLKAAEEEKRNRETEEDQKLKTAELEKIKQEAEEKEVTKDKEELKTGENKKEQEIEAEDKKKEAEDALKLKAVEEEKKKKETEAKKKKKETKAGEKKNEADEPLKLKEAAEEKKKKEAEPEKKTKDAEETHTLKDVEAEKKKNETVAEDKKREAIVDKKKEEAEEKQKLKVVEEEKKKKEADEEMEKQEVENTQKLKHAEDEKKKKEEEMEKKEKEAEEDKKKKEAEEEIKKKETEAEVKKKEAEAEEIKKKEAEEKMKLKVAEEEKKKKEAEAEIKKKEAEEDKKKKEAEEEKKKKEADVEEIKKKEAEAEEMKKKEAEEKMKLKVAEEEKKKKEAEAEIKKKEAEEDKKKKEAEEEKKKKEAEVEEIKKKKAEAEVKKKEADAEEMKKKEVEEDKKKKEVEEKLKLKVAEEEKKKKEAEAETKKKEAEVEEIKKKEAEEDKKKKEAEEEKKKKEAEVEEIKKKEAEAEVKKKEAEAEEMKKKEVEEDKKKKEAEEKLKLKVAEEEKKKKEAEAEMKKKEAEADKKKKETEEKLKIKVAEEEKKKKEAEAEVKKKEAEAEEMNKKEVEEDKKKNEAEEKLKLKVEEEEKKKKEAEAETKKKEAEADKKKKEAEEKLKLKVAEEKKKKKEAEAEVKKKEAEVEEIKKKDAEAEVKKKEAEAEEMKKKEFEEDKKKKEAEEKLKLKVAEEEKKKKKADEEMKKKEAEADKKKKETEEKLKLKVAEEEKKKKEAEAEVKKKEAEAEEMNKKEVEEDRKKKEVEGKLKLKVAEDEKKKKEAEAETKKKEAEADKKKEEAEEKLKLKVAEEEKKKKEAEAEMKKKEAEEKQKQKVTEEEKITEEAEEEKKRKESEAEMKKREAEGEEKKTDAGGEIKKIKAETEKKKQEAEAEKLKKEAEAEKLKKETEAENKKKEAEVEEMKKEAEAEMKKKESEEEQMKIESEKEKKKKEAEAENKKKESEAEMVVKQVDGEKKKKAVDAEIKKKEAEAENKKKWAEEKNKKKEAEEEQKNVNGCIEELAEGSESLGRESCGNIHQEKNGSDEEINHVDKKKPLKTEVEETKVSKKTKELLEVSPTDYNEEKEDEMKMLYGCRIGDAKEIHYDITRKMENDIDNKSDSMYKKNVESSLKKEAGQVLVNDREGYSYGKSSLPTLRIEEPYTNRHKMDVLPAESIREPSQSRKYHTDDISRGSDSLMSIRSISYDSSHREIPRDNSKLKHYLSQSYKDLCLEYSPKDYLVRDDYSEKDFSSIRVSKGSHLTMRDYKYDSTSATLDSIRKKVDKSWRHLNRHLSSGQVASHSVEHLSNERGSRESLGIRKRLGSWDHLSSTDYKRLGSLDHLSSTDYKNRDPVSPVYIEDFSPLAQSRRYTRRRSVSPLPLLGDMSLPVRQRSTSRSRFDHLEKKPYICSSLRDRRVEHGSNVKLTCNIGGEPEPTVEWLKDGQHIQSIIDRYTMEYSFGVASLEIRSVIASDNGQYTCVAVNSAGQAATTATLRINTEQWQGMDDYALSHDPCTLPLRVPEHGPRVTGLIADPLVPSGGVIALHLQIEGCHRAEVTWLKEGAPLPRGLRTHTLVDSVSGLHTLLVESATPAEGGLYQARILSGLGRLIEPAPAHVQVVERRPGDKPALITARPDTRLSLTAGEDLTLTCYVSGEPKPRVVLMKGIKDITDGKKTLKESFGEYVRLTLKRASPQDSGTYFIVARNPYGTDRAFCTVNIRERARSLTPTRRERALSQFRESSYCSSYIPFSSPTYL